MLNYMIQLSQSQGIQCSLLNLGRFNPTFDLFYFNCHHLIIPYFYPLKTFSMEIFRFWAIIAGLLNSFNAAIVAFTKL